VDVEERRAYKGDDMVQNLDEVLKVGELEDGQPSMVVMLDLIIDDHDEAGDQVGCNQTSQTDESLLANAEPWRMADAKEDGLRPMSIDGEDWSGYLHDHPSCCPWEGEPWRKTLC
jgi:hypothetical protein